ncbi:MULTISPECIES: MFS transporter [Streptomyces]|uniref:MFS transporter n=1 Tax=Streptomyces lycopersici TaxID=2974589 RepID=UPI0021D197ED|nr:MFS transporter [Streptomyces sp. NEAU-383]
MYTSASPKARPAAPSRGMTRSLTLLFAFAGGLAVGNLYWAQPLLDFIADDLHASPAVAGWLITVTQIGYAAGIVLLVPLGDVLNRRRLIPLITLASALALAACALAPSYGALAVAITLLGMTTVSGQLLTPLAGDLASDENRVAVVGTVVSGLLTGILVSRTISGLVAQYAGRRAVYGAAAILAVLFAVLLYRSIPSMKPTARMPYPALIASVGTVIRREPAVRWTLVLGAIGFAVFQMLSSSSSSRSSSSTWPFSR